MNKCLVIAWVRKMQLVQITNVSINNKKHLHSPHLTKYVQYKIDYFEDSSS